MELIDKKDGNRRRKLIACKKCGREWPVRKDRQHSGYCRRCKVDGEFNPMYGKKSHNKGNYKHGMSYSKYQWIERKKEIIIRLGNQCCKCQKKNMPIYCYELHHRDPSTKKFSVFSKLTAWNNPKIRPVIESEILKCDLICKNCHSIHHYGEERAE